MLQQVGTLGMKESVGGHEKFLFGVADLAFKSVFHGLDFLGKIKFPVEPLQFA
jgi:hypothetical protein